ncbi:MAG: peptidylprolyl isomerase [Bacteroidales bacterium]|jgi:peptidyl-prolyl cis-trans isomerase SurA
MIKNIKNKSILKEIILILGCIIFVNNTASSQGKVIDQVIATVGNSIILQSDLENQYMQAMGQGMTSGNDIDMKCSVFEDMLFQKLLLNQAQLDSLKVTDSQVESELDRRLRYFVNQIGSQEKLEEYYKKSIIEIKEDFRETVREQILSEQMQRKITDDIKVTPSEVRAYFKKIPADSLPLVNSEVEILQIVKNPEINIEEKKEAQEKIEQIRKRIINGEDFVTLAALYSEDVESAKKGGDIGFKVRSDLPAEICSVAFNLKEKEVSTVIESPAGYHILQLLERRGESIDLRQILVVPKISAIDITKANNFLDSISTLIKNKKYIFSDAAAKFSNDDSRNNGGLIVNPATSSSRFQMNEIDPSLFFVVDKMTVGEISKPVIMKDKNGKQALRVVMLKSRTAPHKANLTEDYQQIQNAALTEKQNRAIKEWINKAKQHSYIKINSIYKGCNFKYNWL